MRRGADRGRTLTIALPVWEGAQQAAWRQFGRQRLLAVQDALAELTEEARPPSS